MKDLDTKTYCGIGSRQTPRNIMQVMHTIAGNLADNLNKFLEL